MARGTETKKRQAARNGLCYLPCRAEPGMFREELLVFLEAVNPEHPSEIVPVQLLVDQREVANLSKAPKRNEPASGWLRATLLATNGEWAEVILPQPSQPLGESILVKKGSVRREPGP